MASSSSTESMRALALIAGPMFALSACGAVAGIGAAHGTAHIPATPASPCRHRIGFELSLVSDTGGQAAPIAAANWFAAHGNQSWVAAHGWHRLARSNEGATLRSGSSTLHVVKGSDGTWQVDSGRQCS